MQVLKSKHCQKTHKNFENYLKKLLDGSYAKTQESELNQFQKQDLKDSKEPLFNTP